MDKIAYILGQTTIYWNSIILTLAVAAAAFFFLAFYIGKCGNAVAGFAAIPVSIVFSVIYGRLFHWYFLPSYYGGFFSAMTDYTSGGYALMGVFLGCLLAAALLRMLCFHRNLPEMLDCMSLAGCAGICMGRLASFFNSSDRGGIIESVRSLPFVYPVTNAVSGAVEYRLATFVIQSMAAFVLLIALSAFYIRGQKRGNLKDGDTCLIFLMCYGCSQVVLDSTRYDSLFFRSNGFVSVVQVLGAVALAAVIVVFSVRMVKARGFKIWQVPVWMLMAAGMGCAGYMEYYVQRHGNAAAFAYSVMSVCLAVVIALTLLVRLLAASPAGKKKNSVG